MFPSASRDTLAEQYVNVLAPFHNKAIEPIALGAKRTQLIKSNSLLNKNFWETYLTTLKIDVICILRKQNSIQLLFAARGFTYNEMPNPLGHIHVGTNWIH